MTDTGFIKRLSQKLVIGAGAAAFLLAACTTNAYTGERKASNTAKGAAIGAAIGAGIGALTHTSKGKEAAKNAAIGAGIGAIAGGAVGIYMDQQEKKLRERLESTGVRVSRDGDQINLIAPGNILFASNSSDVSASIYPTLDSIGDVLKEYDKTVVEVYGHTDSQGSESYNLALSQRRAESVAAYLINRGIKSERFAINGYGEAQPIADNTSEEGRAKNRRVEIKLSPIESK